LANESESERPRPVEVNGARAARPGFYRKGHDIPWLPEGAFTERLAAPGRASGPDHTSADMVGGS